MSSLADRAGRRTKIVCTIGPASNSSEQIAALLLAGMNVARLNFSHGTLEEHGAVIARLRQVSEELKLPLGILQDLPGPKTRTVGPMDGPVQLVAGTRFILTTREIPGSAEAVTVSLPSLPQDVRPGDQILLDDGKIELRVVGVQGQDVETEVISGGPLGKSKGINVPNVTLSVPAFTEHDQEYLRFGLEQRVDFVALSFVRTASDVAAARDMINQSTDPPLLIAKLEKHEAINNLDEILQATDGLMVARGDLGVEIPIEQVPLCQKRIIRAANRVGKPVITATQMLESMITNPGPTRAEVTDVANAIFDGTDAVMLSGETAVGAYPVKAVQMMDKVAREVEPALPYTELLRTKLSDLEATAFDAISYDAVRTAQQLDAALIVAFTTSGSTARRVAKYRPRVPVLAISPDGKRCRQLTLTWGLVPQCAPQAESVEQMAEQAKHFALSGGLAEPGQQLIITAGVPIGYPGRTNLLRIEVV